MERAIARTYTESTRGSLRISDGRILRCPGVDKHYRDQALPSTL
jgi:hypothetical protein